MAHNYEIFSVSLIASIDQFSWWYFSSLTPSDWSVDFVSSKPWDLLGRATYNKTINLITNATVIQDEACCYDSILFFYNDNIHHRIE